MSGDHNMHQKPRSYLDEHKPVGWLDAEMSQAYTVDELADASGTGFLPLYTAPPKREWVGLTDDAVFELVDTNLYEGGKNFGVLAFAKAIEQALKDKNHG